MTEDRLFRYVESLGDANLTGRVRSIVEAARFVHQRRKTDPIEYEGFLVGVYHMVQLIAAER
jgi:hypothetical protein